jgi:hypothetical protein
MAQYQGGDALLDVVDDIEGIGAGALQGDTAGHLPFPIELGDALSSTQRGFWQLKS